MSSGPTWWYVWLQKVDVPERVVIKQDMAVEAVDEETARKLAGQIISDSWDVITVQPFQEG